MEEQLLKQVARSDNLRDAHVYVGGLLAAVGVGAWVCPAAGLAVFGFLLVYIGLVHPLLYAALKRKGH